MLTREAVWLHLVALSMAVGRDSPAKFNAFRPGWIAWNGKAVGKSSMLVDQDLGGGGDGGGGGGDGGGGGGGGSGGGGGRVGQPLRPPRPAPPPYFDGGVDGEGADHAARLKKARLARAQLGARQRQGERLRADAEREGLDIEYDPLGEGGYAGVSHLARADGLPAYRARLTYFFANAKSRTLHLGFFETAEAAALAVARAQAAGVDGLGRRVPSIPLPKGGRLEPPDELRFD